MPGTIWKNQSMIRLLQVGALTLAAALGGCATTGEEGDLHGETHYVLRRGETKHHPAPLPSETTIMVEKFKAEGGSTVSEGFRGWDFDGDGKFEMVDVLAANGHIQSRIYDFDGDGHIDDRALAEAAKAAELPSHPMNDPGFAPSSEPPVKPEAALQGVGLSPVIMPAADQEAGDKPAAEAAGPSE